MFLQRQLEFGIKGPGTEEIDAMGIKRKETKNKEERGQEVRLKAGKQSLSSYREKHRELRMLVLDARSWVCVGYHFS